MPIIDLETGETEKQEITGPRVIDVETGELISITQPSVADAQTRQKPMGLLSTIGEMITGSRRKEMNPDVQSLPEFGATKEGDTLANAAAFLSTFDNEELKDILSKNVEGIKFQDLDDGTVIVEVPDEDGNIKRSVLNRAGLSPQDATTTIAQALSFVPVARLANIGKGIAQKVGIGAVGSGLTEQARQEAVIAQGSEQGRDPLSTGITTALGGASEAIAPLTQTVRQAAQARQSNLENIANTQGMAAQERTGINLFPAQKSLNPFDIETQAYLAQLPSSSTIAMQAIDKQNKEVANAVYNVINKIAPPESLSQAGGKLMNAAGRAIEAKKAIRREKASPIYNQAFKEGADVDVSNIQGAIEMQLDDLSETSQMGKVLKKVSGLISGTFEDGVEINPASLKKLHNAKLEIDEMINGQGENAIGNTTKRALVEIQDDLVKAMEDASPVYRSAREEFAANSPAVDAMIDAVRVSNLKSSDLKSITSKLFEPAEANPTTILNAKKAIQEVDPEAWNYILRAEVEKRLGSVRSNLAEMADTPTGENVPAQIYSALFGNTKSRNALYRALDENQKETFKYLETALKRASKGRPGGSQTAIRKEVDRSLRGGIFEPLRRLFREPIQTITGVGEELSFEQRAAVLADAMFNPENTAKIKTLKESDPRSIKARSIMRQIINTSVKSLPDDAISSFNDVQTNVQEEQQ